MAILASNKHGIRGRHWATRFNSGWFASLGIYRLSGTVRYGSAHARFDRGPLGTAGEYIGDTKKDQSDDPSLGPRQSPMWSSLNQRPTSPERRKTWGHKSEQWGPRRGPCRSDRTAFAVFPAVEPVTVT